MAANVSRICRLVCSSASSGSARSPASLIYELSFVMVGLSEALAARSGIATAAATAPAANDRRVTSFDFIAKYHSAFHNEFHALHFGDVSQRIARHRHYVRELARFHASHLFAQSKVEAFRRRTGGHLQSLRGRHAPFHVVRNLKLLTPMAFGVRAAPKPFLTPAATSRLKLIS